MTEKTVAVELTYGDILHLFTAMESNGCYRTPANAMPCDVWITLEGAVRQLTADRGREAKIEALEAVILSCTPEHALKEINAAGWDLVRTEK